LASHGQCCQTVKLWKGIVGEDYIESAAIELNLKVFAGFDTGDRTGKAVILEQAANEFGVGGTIFQM